MVTMVIPFLVWFQRQPSSCHGIPGSAAGIAGCDTGPIWAAIVAGKPAPTSPALQFILPGETFPDPLGQNREGTAASPWAAATRPPAGAAAVSQRLRAHTDHARWNAP